MTIKKQYKMRTCVTLVRWDEPDGPRYETIMEAQYPWTDDPKVNSLAMHAGDGVCESARKLSSAHPYIFYVQAYDDIDKLWRAVGTFENGQKK